MRTVQQVGGQGQAAAGRAGQPGHGAAVVAIMATEQFQIGVHMDAGVWEGGAEADGLIDVRALVQRGCRAIAVRHQILTQELGIVVPAPVVPGAVQGAHPVERAAHRHVRPAVGAVISQASTPSASPLWPRPSGCLSGANARGGGGRGWSEPFGAYG
ncbi:hypothetical protein AZA_90574 [Nitrospirillum viridazoti Y2]|nr:hypothetical protein AZA_90574 [Nitrospirillum amazonense Y2]